MFLEIVEGLHDEFIAFLDIDGLHTHGHVTNHCPHTAGSSRRSIARFKRIGSVDCAGVADSFAIQLEKDILTAIWESGEKTS